MSFRCSVFRISTHMFNSWFSFRVAIYKMISDLYDASLHQFCLVSLLSEFHVFRIRGRLREHLSSSLIFFIGSVFAHRCSFLCCPINYVSLRSFICVVKFVTIYVWKRCPVRLFLQLYVGGLMSYLSYLCLLAHSGVQHILCCVFWFACFRIVSCVWCCPTHIVLCFLFCLSSSCAPKVASFSGLSILDWFFGFSNVYFIF
jgi:hypothetical protein